jgi:protein phosphatase 2C family protein 2/3
MSKPGTQHIQAKTISHEKPILF